LAVCQEVDKLHGVSAEHECPGASECFIFQASRECPECPRGQPLEIDPLWERAEVAEVRRLVTLRRHGFACGPFDELTQDLIVVWHEREETYKRRHMADVGLVADLVRTRLREGQE
jgi:hypothetical protein